MDTQIGEKLKQFAKTPKFQIFQRLHGRGLATKSNYPNGITLYEASHVPSKACLLWTSFALYSGVRHSYKIFNLKNYHKLPNYSIVILFEQLQQFPNCSKNYITITYPKLATLMHKVNVSFDLNMILI